MGDRKQQRQLLGYLLGALDEAERERIDERLARDPGLAAELARVEESLEPFRAVTRVHAPTPGLAARTCRKVFAYSQALAGRRGEPRAARRPVRERARAMSPAAVPPTSTAAWGWSDLLVAVSVFLAIAGLIFPAIQSSRMNMRLVACQNNLRQLGLTEAQFHETRPAAFAHALAAPGMTVGRIGNPSYGSLLHEGIFVDPTSARTARSPKPASRAMPLSLAGLGRGIAPHQGFRHAVGGQNLLFLDGHVTFVAMGPIVDPTVDPLPPDDPFAGSWSSADASHAPGPSDLAPIVLVSGAGR